MLTIRTIVPGFLLLLASCLPSWAGPLEDLSGLQKDIRSVRAPFRQEKHTELLPRPIKSSGIFFFSRDMGVRWEYRDQMVVVYDNATLYIHYTEMGEAEKIRGIAGFNGPLSFNVSDLRKDYDINAQREDSGAISLELLPRQRMPFKSMGMYFRSGEPFPYEVRVREESGDETVIKFIDPELNVDLKDSLFVFKAPRGVTVRERDFQ